MTADFRERPAGMTSATGGSSRPKRSPPQNAGQRASWTTLCSAELILFDKGWEFIEVL
jgi:hypothetical protein